MNLLLRYVGHGITISLLVFIMLAFHLSTLARTSEKRVLRVAFPQVVGMSWTAEDGSHGSPDKPGGLSIQLCKSEKKEFYIRYSS